MRIDAVRVMPAGSLDEAWRFYCAAFDELRTRAVLRQMLRRPEFDGQMLDERVVKYVCVDRTGTLVGLAAVAEDLHAVHDVSPDYFAHRWPELFAEGRIFYVEFVAARRGAAGAGVYVRLIRELLAPITAARGVAVADICTHNETEYDLPDMFGLAARRVTGEVRQQRLDAQTFWLYEFPATNGALPATD